MNTDENRMHIQNVHVTERISRASKNARALVVKMNMGKKVILRSRLRNEVQNARPVHLR